MLVVGLDGVRFDKPLEADTPNMDALAADGMLGESRGLTQGIARAGFDVITAANHNEYKVEIHEVNHPTTEHWIADLVDADSPAYHSVDELPAGDLLAAGVSCTNHSPANLI